MVGRWGVMTKPFENVTLCWNDRSPTSTTTIVVVLQVRLLPPSPRPPKHRTRTQPFIFSYVLFVPGCVFAGWIVDVLFGMMTQTQRLLKKLHPNKHPGCHGFHDLGDSANKCGTRLHSHTSASLLIDDRKSTKRGGEYLLRLFSCNELRWLVHPMWTRLRTLFMIRIIRSVKDI